MNIIKSLLSLLCIGIISGPIQKCNPIAGGFENNLLFRQYYLAPDTSVHHLEKELEKLGKDPALKASKTFWIDDQGRSLNFRVKLPGANRKLIPGDFSIVELVPGLNFTHLPAENPTARILIIEPINLSVLIEFYKKRPDIEFYVIHDSSEIIQDVHGDWKPGIHGRLLDVVRSREFDYVMGYVNEEFDEEFFKTAKIKGLVQISTGLHNIDLTAADKYGTIVTNAPGPTTTALAEMNIVYILDSLFRGKVFDVQSDIIEKVSLMDLWNQDSKMNPDAVALIYWYRLLKEITRLDEMYALTMEGRYTRTGVGRKATVEHDQLGQNFHANIHHRIGVIGVDEIGEKLIEYAIFHEVSEIYVLEEENIDPDVIDSLKSLIKEVENNARNGRTRIRLTVVSEHEFLEQCEYILTTPHGHSIVKSLKAQKKSRFFYDAIHADEIYISDPEIIAWDPSILSVGVIGFGRIGYEVAQRLIPMKMILNVYQRGHERLTYQEKINRIQNLQRILDANLMNYFTFDEVVALSNILVVATPSTPKTRDLIDRHVLARMGTSVRVFDESAGPVPDDPNGVLDNFSFLPLKILANVVKGAVNEEDLRTFALRHPQSFQVRMDVVKNEEMGNAQQRFLDDEEKPLPNVFISGHSSAAVKPVRDTKLVTALNNLWRLIDGRGPIHRVNQAPYIHQNVELVPGLHFIRISRPNAIAKVLVVEPITTFGLEKLLEQFPDVSFDILRPESEVVEVKGKKISGIQGRLLELIQREHYNYVVGYVNEHYGDRFFSLAQIKGLVQFSTAIRNIDMEAATRHQTVVTNVEGPSTTPVSEQSIGFMLDGIFGKNLFDTPTSHQQPSIAELVQSKSPPRYQNDSLAQMMWYRLMKEILNMEEMFQFGASKRYVRLGVRDDATVYHHQIGQNPEAGIQNAVGIVGLDEVGIQLAEIALLHEVSTIYLLDSEVNPEILDRLQALKDQVILLSQTKGIQIEIQIVSIDELIKKSNFLFQSPFSSDVIQSDPEKQIFINPKSLFVDDDKILYEGVTGQKVGVLGFGRIGQAVAQRALSFGSALVMNQRKPESDENQEKKRIFTDLYQWIQHVRQLTVDSTLSLPEYLEKEAFVQTSDVIVLLAPRRPQTLNWLGEEELNILFHKDTRTIVLDVVGGLILEPALVDMMRKDPDQLKVYIDVLVDEHLGKTQERFLNEDGSAIENIKISGHTGAAVRQIRNLKIQIALRNLRKLLDGEMPDGIVNRDVQIITSVDIATQRLESHLPLSLAFTGHLFSRKTLDQFTNFSEDKLLLQNQDVINLMLRDIIRFAEQYLKESDELAFSAQEDFENQNWQEIQKKHMRRDRLYREFIDRLSDHLLTHYPSYLAYKTLWKVLREKYIDQVKGKLDSDRLLTFFYSIHRRIINHPDISRFIKHDEVAYRDDGLEVDILAHGVDLYQTYDNPFEIQTLIKIIQTPQFKKARFNDVGRDAILVLQKLSRDIPPKLVQGEKILGVDVLAPIFYRYKGAYIIARIRTNKKTIPLIFPLIHTIDGVFVDQVITDLTDVRNIFSSTRGHFRVYTPYYHRLIDFLTTIVPHRTRSVLYAALGLSHHGKIELIEKVRDYLAKEGAQFEWLSSARKVMIDFTFKELHYVLKSTDDIHIQATYQSVNDADRVGRLLDPRIFHNVRFNKSYFSDDLLQELLAQDNVLDEGSSILFKVLYVQEKITPLTDILKSSDEAMKVKAIQGLGDAIRDLLKTGIVLQDINLDQFGMTFGKVVLFSFNGLTAIDQVLFVDEIRNTQLDHDFLFEVSSLAHRLQLGDYEDLFRQLHPDLMEIENYVNWRNLFDLNVIQDFYPYPRDLLFMGNSVRQLTHYESSSQIQTAA